jgi:hypothetical protein
MWSRWRARPTAARSSSKMRADSLVLLSCGVDNGSHARKLASDVRRDVPCGRPVTSASNSFCPATSATANAWSMPVSRRGGMSAVFDELNLVSADRRVTSARADAARYARCAGKVRHPSTPSYSPPAPIARKP